MENKNVCFQIPTGQLSFGPTVSEDRENRDDYAKHLKYEH